MYSASLESIRHSKSSLIVHNKHSPYSLQQEEQSRTPETFALKETPAMDCPNRIRNFNFVLQPAHKRMEAKAPFHSLDSPTSRSSVAGSHSFLQRTKPKRNLTSFVKKRLEYSLEDSSRREIQGMDWKHYLTQFQHTRIHETSSPSWFIQHKLQTKYLDSALGLCLTKVFQIYENLSPPSFLGTILDEEAPPSILYSPFCIFGK